MSFAITPKSLLKEEIIIYVIEQSICLKIKSTKWKLILHVLLNVPNYILVYSIRIKSNQINKENQVNNGRYLKQTKVLPLS